MTHTKMTCPLQSDNTDVLLDYCARALDPERKAMLERHMEQCAECRQMAAAQTELWTAMDAFDAEPVSEDFDRRLYARIRESEAVSPWERYWAPVREYLQGQPAWKPVLSIAAASAVLAVVFLVQGEAPSPVSVPDQPATMVDVKDVEQAERVLEDLEMLRQLEAPAPETAPQKEVL